jgi:hypothetical protein
MRDRFGWVPQAVFFLRFMLSLPDAGRTIPDLDRIGRDESL